MVPSSPLAMPRASDGADLGRTGPVGRNVLPPQPGHRQRMAQRTCAARRADPARGVTGTLAAAQARSDRTARPAGCVRARRLHPHRRFRRRRAVPRHPGRDHEWAAALEGTPGGRDGDPALVARSEAPGEHPQLRALIRGRSLVPLLRYAASFGGEPLLQLRTLFVQPRSAP